MDDEDGGDTVAELRVEGFVMPYLHSEPCAEAAAKYGEQQEGGLADAPLGLAGFPLVDAESEEGGNVDDGEIGPQVVKEDLNHWLV